MAFQIKDNDEAFNANQSIIFETDINAVVAGIGGDGVVSGCAVSAQGSPDMTVAVASGTVRIGTVYVSVTSGNVTVGAADGTNPRIDLVVVNNSGTKSVTAGTAAANPKAPDIPANSVLLAMIYVPASDTTIASNQITDKRLLLRALVQADMPSDVAQNPPAVFEDFLYGGGGFNTNTSGTGAAAGNNVAASVDLGNHPGQFVLETGTSTGRAGFGFSAGTAGILFGNGAVTWETDIYLIDAVSDGTDTYSLFCGFNDLVTGTGTDSIMFRYLHSVNSGKFECVTRANGSETAADSGQAVATTTWYRLGIQVNAAATSVAFLINGATVATNTTNIPTGSGRQTAPHIGIVKSAGTSNRRLSVDYVYFRVALTSSR